MIRCVSATVYYVWSKGTPTRWPKRGRVPTKYLCVTYIFTLEDNGTKLPTWRGEEIMSEYAGSRLYHDIQIESRKKNVPLLVGEPLPWIDDVYPNKPVSKGDIVTLFPECKEMPRPYALDYVRDRA